MSGSRRAATALLGESLDPMANPNLCTRLSAIVDELVRRGVTLEQARREFEKQYIVASLRTNDGNLGRSARSLGVHRNTLRNKVCTLGIEQDELRAAGIRSTRRRTIDT